MRIKVVQPPYPWKTEDTGKSISFICQELQKCDDSLDLILMPECCNAPSGCGSSSALRELSETWTEPLLSNVREAAKRCRAHVCINVYCQTPDGLFRNTTLLFDRNGQEAYRYEKIHLPASEYQNALIDHSYLATAAPPRCFELDGIRYAFLTCYDIYYVEYIARLAMEQPDIVLLCSLQREERADILEMQVKNCAFMCNAYVLRSSFSMGAEKEGGACSMAASPAGKILRNIGQAVGSFELSIDDVHAKYMRTNGFGQPEVSNEYYQTHYRTPWTYRPAGAGIKPTSWETGWPRLCAHRGMVHMAPENTIPSMALAVSLGCCELEIDVRPTKDGVLVISHDPHVHRLTDSDGIIQEMTYDELMRLDPGAKFGHGYEGVRYATLEEVFSIFARRTIINLHVKPLPGVTDYSDEIREIMRIARKYDCVEHFFFASEEPLVLDAAMKIAPEVERCVLASETDIVTTDMMMANAAAYKCTRLQALRVYMTDELISRAHAAGIKCNLFYSDEPEDARQWLDKGVDCILTDNYLAVRQGLGIS